MSKGLAKAALGALLAAALSAAGSEAQAPAPAQTYLISLSLVEALVAIDKTDLSAVFSFVPEQNAPMALATYLMGDQRALKRFIKKWSEIIQYLSMGLMLLTTKEYSAQQWDF